MTEFLTFIYIVIFILGLFSDKFLAVFLPIFSFSFPVNLEYLNYNGFSLYMLYILIAFVVYYFSKNNSFDNNHLINWKKITVRYFIIIGFYALLLSILFVPNTFLVSFKDILSWLLYLLVFLLYFRLCRKESLKIFILLGFILAALIQSIVSIGLIYDFTLFKSFYDGNIDDVIFNNNWRATGTFKGPWDLGGYLSLSIVFFFICLDSVNKWIKFIMFVTIGLCIYALILTYSRASWLLLLSAILYISIFNKKKMITIFASVVLLAFVSSYFIDINSIVDMINHRTEYTFNNNETGGLDNSSIARLNIWKNIFNNYEWNYFISGYGIKNVYLTFGSTPHNTFLSLLLNGGIIAVLFILRWFKIIYTLSKKTSQLNKILIRSLLIGIIFYGLTADIFYNLKVIIIMILYTTFAMFYRLAKD